MSVCCNSGTRACLSVLGGPTSSQCSAFSGESGPVSYLLLIEHLLCTQALG